jgi:biopolymer transport protein ExbB
MMQLVDQRLPWLLDLLELGGPVLGVILVIAMMIWVLLFERMHYQFLGYREQLGLARTAWAARGERTSWYAQQSRRHLVNTLGNNLTAHYPLVATLIKLCPLLGLLGTVLGMLEVFDALASTGSNNPRSMAAGVSKATVSTLAGMVVAIAALLTTSFMERRAQAERSRLSTYFESAADHHHA